MPTLALLVAVFVMPTQIAPAEYKYIREPATGSIWVSRVSFIANLIAEWDTRGHVYGLTPPFSPFTYEDPGISFNNQPTAAFPGDDFAVVVSNGIYRRQASGGFAWSSLFDVIDDPLCRQPSQELCEVILLGVDGRSRSYVTYLRGMELVVRVWRDGAYRALVGWEAELTAPNYPATVWNADGATAWQVNFDYFSQEPTFTVDRYSAAGRVPVSLAGISHRLSSLGPFLQTDGNTTYLVGEAEGVSDPLFVYRLEVVADNLVEARPVRHLPLPSQVLTIAAGQVYARTDRSVFVYPIDGSPARVLVTCASGAPQQITSEGRQSHALWIGCDHRVLQLKDGAIAQTLLASGPVLSGSALDGREQGVVVNLPGGVMEHLSPGQPARQARLLPTAVNQDALAPIWEERTAVCGVAQNRGTVVCHIGTEWVDTVLPIGTPTAVRHTSEGWWALSQREQNRWDVSFRAIDGDWQEVAQLLSVRTPVFVADGLDGVAVDTGDTALTLLRGHVTEAAYNHGRASIRSVPAIDVDGVLYDACTQGRLCAVSPTGRISVVTGVPEPREALVVRPLRRGVLAQIDGAPFVVRGSRAIALGRLYGEFAVSPGDVPAMRFVEAGQGELIISFFKSQANTQWYLYDGINMRHAPEPQGGLEELQTFFPASLFNETNPQPVWQGADYVWRIGQKNAPDGWSVGLSAVDAVGGGGGLAPNDVHDAVALGSGDILLATPAGLWQCPERTATRVGLEDTKLPQTPGCYRPLAWPFVQRIVRRGQELYIQQGYRIVRLDEQRERIVATLSHDRADHLNIDGASLTWIERQQLIHDDGVNTRVIDLPPDVADVVDATAQWLCSAAGVDRRSPKGWERKAHQSCRALLGHGDEAYAIMADALWTCDSRGCASVATLPSQFAPDGVLGEVRHDDGEAFITLVLGTSVWRFADGWHDITPRYGRGSLLLSRAHRVGEAGIISTRGGGVVLLSGNPEAAARHIRIQ